MDNNKLHTYVKEYTDSINEEENFDYYIEKYLNNTELTCQYNNVYQDVVIKNKKFVNTETGFNFVHINIYSLPSKFDKLTIF